MEKNIHICIIGAGAMGSSIASIVSKNEHSWKLSVVDSKRDYSSLSDADVVLIAVKPQSFLELSNSIKTLLKEKTLVVSIMAGVSIATIERELHAERVVRAMPNLGAQFAESMTVWCGKNLTSKDRSFARAFFALMGEQFEVSDEDFVDKATAVSGSGVGFLTYIIEAYIAETIKLGFSPSDASTLVLQTLKATNTLLQKKDKTPEQIRTAVTSKGGTTEAGLTALMKRRLSGIFAKTFKKAYARAKKLSK